MKKIIILGFDKVFYTGQDVFKNVPDYINRNRRNFLPNVSDDIYKKICAENPEFVSASTRQEIAKSILDLKAKYPYLTIKVSDFLNVQQNEIYDIYLKNAKIVDANRLKNICSNYHTYIVTNSSLNHINHYLEKLNVKPEWFSGIICNHYESYDQTKKHYYQDIMNKENAKPYETIVFGDDEIADLIPARKLGIKAVLSGEADNLHNLIIEQLLTMNKIIDCFDFQKQVEDYSRKRSKFNQEVYDNMLHELEQKKNLVINNSFTKEQYDSNYIEYQNAKQEENAEALSL